MPAKPNKPAAMAIGQVQFLESDVICQKSNDLRTIVDRVAKKM